MRLGSGIAVAVVEAGSCISDLTPSLGISICHGCSPKKEKKKKKDISDHTSNNRTIKKINHLREIPSANIYSSQAKEDNQFKLRGTD